MIKFKTPDYEADRRELKEEESRGQGIDWKEVFWKPKPVSESPKGNRIRIFPARAGVEGANYHMQMAKHFIQHEDRKESFLCMKRTYGKACPACEKATELFKEAAAVEKMGAKVKAEKLKQEARMYKPTRRGVFNIIDRSESEPKVWLYESPISAVWQKVVQLVEARGEMSNLFDAYDEKGNLVKSGRDLYITFDPESEFQAMYTVMPSDQVELGTKEEVEKWFSQMIDLLPQNIYPEVEYETAQIKTFGTIAEREELRKVLQEMYETEQKTLEKVEPESEKEEKKEEEEPEPKWVTEDLKKDAVKEPKEEKKEAKKEKETKGEKEPEPEKKGQSSEGIQEKIARIRAKRQTKK